MKKYVIYFDGESEPEDRTFSSEEAAEEYANYLRFCYQDGAEILHMSNPGENDYDEETYEAPEYEIVEEDVDDDDDEGK